MPLNLNLVKKLEVLGSDVVVKPIVRELAERRAQKTTDVYRIKLSLLKGGAHYSDDQIRGFFEKLERLGCGKLKIQYRPLHDIFTWSLNIHDVVDALLGKHLLQEDEGESTVTTVTTSSISPLAASTTVILPTPSGNPATLSLDAPMDRKTALMMAQYLTKLGERLR